MNILETKRLTLRTFNDDDLEPMYQLNQDPKVMEYFPSLPTLEETKQFIQKMHCHYEQYGYALYAAERKDTGEFIGFIGLLTPDFDAHFMPATEIGWRLASKHWGQGFAPEGAKAVLDYAFTTLKLPKIVSFTAIQNKRSIRVMEKIGLQHNCKDDFDNPKLSTDSPLCRHVLFHLTHPRDHIL